MLIEATVTRTDGTPIVLIDGRPVDLYQITEMIATARHCRCGSCYCCAVERQIYLAREKRKMQKN